MTEPTRSILILDQDDNVHLIEYLLDDIQELYPDSMEQTYLSLGISFAKNNGLHIDVASHARRMAPGWRA